MSDDKQPAVYIISNKRHGVLYIGVTSGLWQRIWDHKNGRFEGFSKKYGLGRLVWYEHHPTMPSAIHRETRLKKWKPEWKLNLVDGFNPPWLDLHEAIDSDLNVVEEFATRKVLVAD
jgi:putative endonuclease